MSQPGAPPVLLIVALFAVSFTAIWAFVTLLLSRASGWSTLASAYPCPSGAEPRRWTFRTAYLRAWLRYEGVLRFDADAEGFTVAPVLIFRLGHPALRVPWRDVTVSEESLFFRRCLRLSLAKAPGVPMRIPRAFAEELLAARGQDPSHAQAPAPGAIAPR